MSASYSILSIDFETASQVNLPQVGADVYARHPSTRVTVVAWAFGDDPVDSVSNPCALPPLIRDHLENGGRFRAWNAAFETAILRHVYKIDLAPEQVVCTMQQGLYSGLPPALGDAGPALGVSITKDLDASRLMKRMARPRVESPIGPIWWHDAGGKTRVEKLDRLEAYCRRDVEAEREIARNLRPLPRNENEVSLLDRAANERGVQLDLKFVAKLKAIALTEISRLNRECEEVTGRAVTSPGTQTERLRAWAAAMGIVLADLSKETVAAALAHRSLPPKVRWVLEIRQEIAKSSTRKLDAMTRCAGPDGRVRGQLAYYGAFRTGRFAGRLIQPQNFPRPTIKLTKLAVQNVLDGADADFLRVVYGKPLEIVAILLRACLIPGPGMAFVVYDLSQIEARVVAWLAGQTDMLDVFARGEDPYVYTAARVGSSSRQFGKVLVLACGFGMGPGRFQETALVYGITLTARESEEGVKGWRDANTKIVSLWWRTDRVVKEALRTFKGAKPVTIEINDKLSVMVSASRTGAALLTIRLPNGRRLYYRNARLVPGGKYGDEIAYDGVDQKTKQWGTLRTYGGKLVENITQATARDVIVEAALRVDRANLGRLVLSVHDELVFEVPKDEAEGKAPLIQAEINHRPPWAFDLPTASEGGVKHRYGK
jgi:DNA polymerase bacteriophage-type